MACSDFSSYVDFWVNAQFADAIICPFQDVMGLLLFATLFWGAIALYMGQASRSVAVPLIIAILVGAVAVTELPPEVASLAGVLALLGISAMVWLWYQRIRGGPV